MKIKNRIPFAAIGIITATLSPLGAVDIYTWDADTVPGGGAQDGTGAWSNDSTNWISGGSNVPFVSVNTAQVTRTTTASAVGPGATTLTLTDVTGLVVGQELSIGNFPTGTTITGISGNTITLSSPSTGNIGASTNINFQAPRNTAIFGSGGTAGTVTVSGASGTKNVGSLILNATASGNYTFTGDALALGSMSAGTNAIVVRQGATFNNVVNSNGTNTTRIRFETANQTLSFNGGGTILAQGNGAGIYGSDAPIARSSTISVTGGTYTGIFGTWNIGNANTGNSSSPGANGLQFSGNSLSQINILQIGNDGNGNLAVTQNAEIRASGQVSIGRGNNANNVGRVTVEGNRTGNLVSFSTIAGDTNQSVLQIGREGGTGFFDQKNGKTEVLGNGLANTGGGVVVLNSANRANALGKGELNISGGVMTIKDLRFNGTNQHQQDLSNQGSSIVNLSGGALYVGGTVRDNTSHNGTGQSGVSGSEFTTQGGISNRGVGTSSYQFNFSGGTLGSNADGTKVSVNIALSNTTEIKAADELNNARSLEISGILSGTGGFTKTGGGILTLSGVNTYEGGTSITGGTLVAASAGALGTDDINLGNATLSLTVANVIADTATLFFSADSLINLDYLGDDTVLAVTNTTTSQSIGSGTRTAAELNAFFGGNYFSGTGTLTTVIPEPSSMALLGLGLAGMTFTRRRKVA